MNISERRRTDAAEPAPDPATVQALPRLMLLERAADLAVSVARAASAERLAFDTAALREEAGLA